MYESLQAGKRVMLDRVGMFADGVAVRRVGEESFALARRYVDEILLVNTDEICAAIQDIFEDTRSICEPAGALAVAGIKHVLPRRGWHDQRLVAINSGANMNFDRLRHVAERADMGAEREALLAVEIPERPGSFLNSASRSASAASPNSTTAVRAASAHTSSSASALHGGHEERDALIAQLRAAGYQSPT